MPIKAAFVNISLALLLQTLLLSSSSSVSIGVLLVFSFFFTAFLFLSHEEAFSAAVQPPEDHTVTATATNPRSMHHFHQISSTYHLPNGSVSVSMHFLSTPGVVDDYRSRLGLAVVTFFMAEKALLIGVPPPPPGVRNPADFVAPYRSAWAELLRCLVREGPSPAGWSSVAERIHSATRVPIGVRNALVRRILGEATAAARAALALRHRTVSMAFVVEVLIDVDFDSRAWQQHGVVALPPAPEAAEEEQQQQRLQG